MKKLKEIINSHKLDNKVLITIIISLAAIFITTFVLACMVIFVWQPEIGKGLAGAIIVLIPVLTSKIKKWLLKGGEENETMIKK